MSFLEKFTVVDLIKTRSASIVTINGNILKFNKQTAGELHYSPYVQVLVNPKEKQFAIRSCKENAPHAVPFSKPEGEQRYQIKINAAAVLELIRKMTGWSEEETWSIPGVYFAAEDALLYDAKAAFEPSGTGGLAAKRQREAAALALDLVSDNTDEGNQGPDVVEEVETE